MRYAIPILFLMLIVAVVVGYGLWSSGDRGERHTPSKEILVSDLVHDSPIADYMATTTSLNFGTPQGKHCYDEADLRYHSACKGWYSFRDEERAQDCAMLLGGSGTFIMTVLDPCDGVLTLKGCAPEGGGSDTADLRLYLNHHLIAEEKLPRRLDLHLLRFAVAAKDLLEGDNLFRVEVDNGIRFDLPDLLFPVMLSAVFVSATLEPYSRPNPMAPLVVPGSGESQPPALVHGSGTRLEYFHLPEPGEHLKGVAVAKGGPIKALITITRRGESSCELFSRIIASDIGPVEIDVDLSPYADQPCCICLLSGHPGVVRHGSYIRWESLRIVNISQSAGALSRHESPRARHESDSRAKVDIQAKPDLIVLLLDAASAFFFECLGGRKAVTPAVDAFSREAVVFRHAVTPAPYTLPAVGSLMTGQVPDRHGVVWNANRDGVNLKLSSKTLTAASLLKAQGYSTYGVVTNPNAAGLYGFATGFDQFEELFSDPDLWDEGVDPAAAIEKAKALIQKHKKENDSPFYLYLHLFQPHAPYTPPETFVSRFTGPYEGIVDGKRPVIDGFKDKGEPQLSTEDFDHLRDLYAANLAYVDEGTGELLDWMRAEGYYNDALIVVCSDHGEAFGEHDSIEHGHHLYEEALRIPLMIKYPDARFAGKKVDDAVCLTDLPHTLVAAGGADPLVLGEDGIDLTTRLNDSTSWPDRVLSARSDIYKPSFSLRWRGYQYIYDTLSRRSELYFLPDDPAQQNNIVNTHRVTAGYLRTELCRYFAALAKEEKGERVKVDEGFIHSIEAIGYTGNTNNQGTSENNTTPLPLGKR